MPPLVFSQAYEVSVPGGVTDIACIRDELMVATQSGHILRYMWDGQVNRDYCLDLRRIPFCMDQQVSSVAIHFVRLSSYNVFMFRCCVPCRWWTRVT